MTDREASAATGVPVSTLRKWRYAGRRPEDVREMAVGEPPQEAYAYLLGAYLGDGHLALHPREVYRLVIHLDAGYPAIIDEVAQAMEAVMPEQTAHRLRMSHAAMVRVSMYSRRWPLLFPQHGPGRKHERAIHLAAWQQQIVDAHHEAFLRGLIHSDGCRHINRVRRNGKAYEYWRYEFTNASADIRALFCASCDALGIPWRQMNARNISVARREGVARLDEFVGPKR